MAPHQESELPLIDFRTETPGGEVRTFVLPRPERFAFEPGQYVWFEVADRTAYPMAIASGIHDANLEFSIRGNPGNQELFSKSAGDLIRISSAMGSAFPSVHLDTNSPLVLVAGGTGVTPVRSILRSLREPERARIVVGTRGPKELMYTDELTNHPDVTLTVENPDADWSGVTGRVTDYLEPLSDTAVVFVCGPNPMMAAVRDQFRGAGVPLGRVYLSVQALDAEGQVLGPVLPADHPSIPF
ncbi:MAG: hypothetical protein AAF658_10085 [Myxococcota bacterium]